MILWQLNMFHKKKKIERKIQDIYYKYAFSIFFFEEI